LRGFVGGFEESPEWTESRGEEIREGGLEASISSPRFLSDPFSQVHFLITI